MLADRVPRAVLELQPRARAADRSPPLAEGRLIAVAVCGPRGRLAAAGLGVAVEDGTALPERTGALVDLRALDAPADVDGALACAKASLFLAQRARPLLLDSAKHGGAFYLVVTQLEGSSHPATAAVHGLLKTASLEWPEVACAVVDVHPSLEVAAVVAEELRTGFIDLEVVRTPEGRFCPAVVERPVPAARTRPSSAAVWVASGGARGVTATTLLALARATRPALLLLGRTPLAHEPACASRANDEPALKKALIEDAKANGRPLQLAAIGEEARRILAVREIAGFVRELESAGARVLYRAVDVRDVIAVENACSEARASFGPITGLVHGAGVLADKRIEDKTADQVDRVMDTKVLGLEALLRATSHDPIDTVALFSSVAGRFGNVGQVDYSMANEALNEMAHHIARMHPGAVVKSMNWGPWEGGMVTPALKKVFEERGVRVLSHADGARHFVDELSARDGVLEVVYGGELAPAEGPAAQVAPASVGSTSMTKRFQIDARGWPFLADHAVKGTVVLPVVGALELFAQATNARVFEDVRVLRGVRLPRFAHEGHALEVTRDGTRVALGVVGEKTPSYTARVGNPAAPFAALGEPTVAAATWGDLYAGPLFHGARFHLVDVVEGAGRDGLIARVRGCLERDWGEALAVDMGALDAALQAALLWTRHATGGAFLPTAIARVRVGEPVNGPLRCVLVARDLHDTRGLCDVRLFDMSGRTAFALDGVEVHRLPDDTTFAPAPAVVLEAVR